MALTPSPALVANGMNAAPNVGTQSSEILAKVVAVAKDVILSDSVQIVNDEADVQKNASVARSSAAGHLA
jgi:hypothetical protein